MPTEPLVVGGEAALSVNDPAEVLGQMEELARMMRLSSPELKLSQAQAFARVADIYREEMQALTLGGQMQQDMKGRKRPTGSSPSYDATMDK